MWSGAESTLGHADRGHVARRWQARRVSAPPRPARTDGRREAESGRTLGSANRCLEVGHEGDLSAHPRWPRGVRLRGGAAAPPRRRRGARAGPRRRRHPHGTLLGSDLDHTGGRAARVPGHSRTRILRRDRRPGAEGRDAGLGDLVYGLNDWYRDGASAEYCVARVADLAHKPSSVDHVHAAATPISALTAWQGLIERAGLAA